MPFNTPEKRRENYRKNRRRILDAHKRYRLKNIEKFRLISQKYYQIHKKEDNERKKKWRRNNPEKDKEQRRKFYYKNRDRILDKRKNIDWKIRKDVIDYLGGKCVKCGYSLDWRALQIDHINGHGSLELNIRGRRAVYKEILAGERNDVQLLCANCNWLKRYENHEFANQHPPRTSRANLEK